ncbi:amidohydrolase family protein [Brucella pseudogrignonensis]|uniref:amidohydrolase family protein n=1 Tax=Brucella pseudogrignonensis TaxID=419475 RepID=UPI001E307E5C|nr:amidohydrolase family protein [Brucella pseudogrignonensis]MCD4511762.1 amidohydrolase family protein [Brucella pseudogrignonensis]
MTQEEYVFEFVDAHHHLWDLKRLYYAWLTDKPFNGHPSGDYSKIMKDYLIDDLRREAEAVNLIKSIHIETADGETDPVHETQWLQEVADEKGMPNGIIARCDLTGEKVVEELEHHQRFSNFRGVRMLSFMGLDFLDAAEFRRGFKELAKRNLVYDMDAGWQQMHKAYALAKDFPTTRIILGHCGFPKERNVPYFHRWRKAIAQLAKAPNVACKLSGLAMVDHNWTVETIRPWIETCIEYFGVDRCMFGTNWPLDGLHSEYATVVNAYREIVDDYSIPEKRQLFRLSAENWYRI